MYRYEIRHAGLHKYQVIREQTEAEARAKAEAKMASWESEFARIQLRESKRRQFDYRKTLQAARKEEALERTREAEQEFENLKSLLGNIVDFAKPFNVSSLKKDEAFPKPQPIKPVIPENRSEPKRSDREFGIKMGPLDYIFYWRRKRKQRAAEDRFVKAHFDWTAECRKNNNSNAERIKRYESEFSGWSAEKLDYDTEVYSTNKALDDLNNGYLQSDAEATTVFFTCALQEFQLPDIYSGQFNLFFDASTKTLVVDFDLPELESIQTIKAIRYSTSKNDFEQVAHKDSVIQSLFDNLVYQTCLGIIYLILCADYQLVLIAVVFNGWVTYMNRAIGNDTTACIASLHVTRDEFAKINLLNVDARACFRALKGISSPQVHSLTPVRPIISLNREDSRFVQSRDVIERIDTGANIAAIGWEEFEHLIREIFEREFSTHGGEVKVTQASRDGGVDAVAFDPDPIRGGKIIIQAKRYTNTVDVSSVRDLYGTVMSEGATKGILVTTSSFGPDAHRFAKDKPITLMDGNNLLFLLAKHGHQARIDLAEAKKLGNALRR